jgi:uncharacterized protein
MKNPVFFETLNRNHYLYSPYRNQLRLCHPLIPWFHTLEPGKNGIQQWLQEAKQAGSASIPGAGSFSWHEIEYQFSKYRFLRKHGFFKPARMINLKGRLKPSDIRDNLAHVKQIIFEVTEDCNLCCDYCTYSKFYLNKPRANRSLRFEDARHTLRALINKRTPSPLNQLIISFYGGEPLKNFPFIRSVVEFTRQVPPGTCSFRFTMSSNGLLLKKYIGFLVDHSFELSVSLDGDAFANSFRVTRNRKPSFDLVTGNLDYIKKTYPEYFEKYISFLTVMHNRNSYQTIHRFFMERYGKLPMISDINAVNLDPCHEAEFRKTFRSDPVRDKNESLTTRLYKTRSPRVRDMSNMIEHYSGFVFKNFFEMFAPGPGKPATKKFIPTATCTPFSIRAYFTADGGIMPCEHISRFHEIASYAGDRLYVRPREIARLYNRYYDKISVFCSKCYFSDNCKECIFNTGIETSRPVCEYYMREPKFREYLSQKYSELEKQFRFHQKMTRDAIRQE